MITGSGFRSLLSIKRVFKMSNIPLPQTEWKAKWYTDFLFLQYGVGPHPIMWLTEL